MYNISAAAFKQELGGFIEIIDTSLPKIDQWYRSYNADVRPQFYPELEGSIRPFDPQWTYGHEDLELHQLEAVCASLKRKGLY